MEKHGTGIEIRTDRSPTNGTYQFDGVSWTRARMVIYPSGMSIDMQANSRDYCADFNPTA